MKRICLTASFLLCGILSAQTPLKTYTASDVNQNNTVDVEDVTQVVNAIMGKSNEGDVVSAASLNEMLKEIYKRLDKLEGLYARVSRVESMLGIQPPVEPITFEDWVSTNHADGTTDSHTYTISIDTQSELAFDWSVSSEAKYDILTVTLDGKEILSKSGIDSGHYTEVLKAGEHTLIASYTKDKSTSSNDDRASLYNVVVTPKSETPEQPVTPPGHLVLNGHECVDLGLPSGTLWATCNVGANKPEEMGLFFAWGETVGYTFDTDDGHSFDWDSYTWGEAYNLKKYNTISSYGKVDLKVTLDPEDDAAQANWKGSWRMPTREECEELVKECNFTYNQLYNGMYGTIVSSKVNDNFIFLPYSGSRWTNSFSGYGQNGGSCFWSSSMYNSDPSDAFYFFSNSTSVYATNRCAGYSVRPVCKLSK